MNHEVKLSFDNELEIIAEYFGTTSEIINLVIFDYFDYNETILLSELAGESLPECDRITSYLFKELKIRYLVSETQIQTLIERIGLRGLEKDYPCFECGCKVNLENYACENCGWIDYAMQSDNEAEREETEKSLLYQ